MLPWLHRLRLLPRRHFCFIFHRLLPEPDPLLAATPTAAEFDARLGQLVRQFRFIPLAESLVPGERGERPTASLTFDDGYADNLHLLLPILQKHKVSTTVFCTTAFLGGDLMWNDWLIEWLRARPAGTLDLRAEGLGLHELSGALGERRALLRQLLPAVKYWPLEQRKTLLARIRAELPEPPRLMLDADELRALAAGGVEIGGHTHDHTVLTTLDDEAARWQIRHNRALLGELTGEPPRLFAYPNGAPGQDYQARHAAMVREAGYTAAWTTAHGAWDGQSDKFQIPRFTPWRWDALHFHKDLWQIAHQNHELAGP